MFKDPYDCQACRLSQELCGLHLKIARLHAPTGCEFCRDSEAEGLKCLMHRRMGRVYG